MGVAHLLADAGHLLVDDVVRRPCGRQSCLLVQEVDQGGLSVLGVEDLGVPLQPVEATARVLEGSHRRLGGGGGDREALRGGLDRVTVTHPHHLVVRGAVEQAGALLHAGGGVPVLAGAGASDRSAQGLSHGLESVADAQDRHSGVEEGRINGGGAVGVDRGGATGEDDGRRLLVQHGGGAHGVGHDLGVDTGLAHAAGDELGVLGAEVHHEDGADGAGRSLAGRHRDRIAGAATGRLPLCRTTTTPSLDVARHHRMTRPVVDVALLPHRSRLRIKTTETPAPSTFH